MPRELEMLMEINQYGAQAILGRPLGVKEIRRMAVVQNIIMAYQKREAAEDKDKWALAHPELNHLLNEAILLAVKDGR